MGKRRAAKRGSGNKAAHKKATESEASEATSTPAKKMAKVGPSSAATSLYDWNAPARAFRIHPAEPESWEQAMKMGMDQATFKNLDGEKRLDLATKEKLQHGDVLAFGDYRYTDAYFVQRTEGGGFNWVENDNGSGYLTIPQGITSKVTDIVTKYADILKGNLSCNMNISSLDKWVEEKYGADVPDTYHFDLIYVADTLDEICVKVAGADWSSFTPDQTWEDIKAFFEGASDEQNKFSVEVSLKGEKFAEYKEKYGKPNSKYAWLTAMPKLPKTWKVEKGASAAGPDNASWAWSFTGSAEHFDSAKQATTDFLGGFEYKFM